MLTDEDMEYMEGYSPMEKDNPMFCNMTTMSNDIVVDKEMAVEPLCNLYHIKVDLISSSP